MGEIYWPSEVLKVRMGALRVFEMPLKSSINIMGTISKSVNKYLMQFEFKNTRLELTTGEWRSAWTAVGRSENPWRAG